MGKIPWRRAWQPTPAFLPGEPHGQRSLVGCSPQGCKEPDSSEQLTHTHPGCWCKSRQVEPEEQTDTQKLPPTRDKVAPQCRQGLFKSKMCVLIGSMWESEFFTLSTFYVKTNSHSRDTVSPLVDDEAIKIQGENKENIFLFWEVKAS